MKKFFCAAVMLIMLSITIFSGCSLFEKNAAVYYKQTVASTKHAAVGNVSVKMWELEDAFNNYGYQYIEQEGLSRKKAVNKTIQDLIDRKLIIKYFDTQENPLYTLDAQDEIKVKKEVYDSINGAVDSYVEEIRKENKIVFPSEASDTSADTSQYVYVPYEPQIEFSYNETAGRQVFQPVPKKPAETVTDPGDFKFTNTIGASGDKDAIAIKNQAINRFYKALRQEAKRRGKTVLDNESLLNAKIEQMINAATDSAKINKMTKIFEDALLEVDYTEMNRIQSEIDVLTVQLAGAAGGAAIVIENEIKSLKRQLSAVQAEAGGIISINSEIVEVFKDLYYTEEWKNSVVKDGFGPNDMQALYYYVPQALTGKFFTVSHILISYTDKQKAKVEKDKDELAKGKIDQAEYNERQKQIIKEVTAKARNAEGVEEGSDVTALGILNQIRDSLKTLTVVDGQGRVDEKRTQEARAVKFNELVYKYNSDPGILNSERDYYIPDASLNLPEGTEGLMVKPFETSSREVRARANNLTAENSTYTSTDANDIDFVKGLSGLVETEYGYHIIYYTGEVTSLGNIITATDESILTNLYNRLTKLGHNKTYYHLVYEQVVQRDFNTFLNSLIETVRSDITIKIYKDRLSDVY